MARQSAISALLVLTLFCGSSPAVPTPINPCIFRSFDEATYRSNRTENALLGFETLVYPRLPDAPLQLQLLGQETSQSYVISVLDSGSIALCTNHGPEWSVLEFEFHGDRGPLVRYGSSERSIYQSFSLSGLPSILRARLGDNHATQFTELRRRANIQSQTLFAGIGSDLSSNALSPHDLSIAADLMSSIRVSILNTDDHPDKSVGQLDLTCIPVQYTQPTHYKGKARTLRLRDKPIRLSQSVVSTPMKQSKPGVFEGVCDMSALKTAIQAHTACSAQAISLGAQYGFPTVCSYQALVRSAYSQLDRLVAGQSSRNNGLTSISRFLQETAGEAIASYEHLCTHVQAPDVQLRLDAQIASSACGPPPEVVAEVRGPRLSRMLGSLPATQRRFEATIHGARSIRAVGTVERFLRRLVTGSLTWR